MATKILDGVLSLTIRVVGWWIDDPGTGLSGAVVVAVDVAHANHYGVIEPTGRLDVSLSNDDRTIAKGKLGAMMSDAQPFDKSEGTAEPVGRLADAGIGKLGDDYAGGHGAVGRYRRLFARPFHWHTSYE